MGKKSLLTLQTVTKKVVLQSENVNIVIKKSRDSYIYCHGMDFFSFNARYLYYTAQWFCQKRRIRLLRYLRAFSLPSCCGLHNPQIPDL